MTERGALISLRRRDVLRVSLIGVGVGLAGCTGAFFRDSASATEPSTERLGECSPSGAYTDPPSGWPLRRFDPGATGHAPAEHAPGDFPLEVAWTFEGPARTPVVADGTAYIAPSQTYRIHALDAATGDERWAVRTEGPVTSGPVVHDDAAYVVFEREDISELVALDADTGENRWTTEIPASATDLLTITNGAAFVGGGGPMLEAIETAGGKSCWRFTPGGRSQALAGLAVDSDIVCLTVLECAGDVCPADGTVYGLKPGTGEIRWRFDPQAEVNAPSLGGGTVYGSVDTSTFALEKSTGDEQRSIGLEDQIKEAHPDRPPLFSGHPAVADGTVYVSRSGRDAGGLIEAIDVSNWTSRWQYPLEPTEEFDGLTSPSIAGGFVFVGTGSGAYAVDASTGDRRWNEPTTGTLDVPAIADGRVYYGNTDGPVYVFE